MVRLNLVYDLLQTTKISSNTLDRKRDKRMSQIYFVICNSCYWCASYFSIYDLKSSSTSSSPSCQICNSHNTELISIATDESFRIEYNPSRGLEIEFYR